MAKKIETKVVKRTKVEKEMTLLRAIERVVEVSKDSKLKAEAKAEMAAEVKYLAERYGITERHSSFQLNYIRSPSLLIWRHANAPFSVHNTGKAHIRL